MAQGSEIYKVQVSLSNLNSHYYDDFALTLARHPSESEARLMFRLTALLHSSAESEFERLQFTKGISTQEEPDIWQKNYSGDILQWIELGQPDLKRLRQAMGKSQIVRVYTYNPNTSGEWYQKISRDILNYKKLEIFHLEVTKGQSLENLISRTMDLSCLIEEQVLYLSNDSDRVEIEVIRS